MSSSELLMTVVDDDVCLYSKVYEYVYEKCGQQSAVAHVIDVKNAEENRKLKFENESDVFT